MGDHFLGVRLDSAEAAATLETVLAPYLASGATGPNYSVRVGGSPAVGRGVGLAYRSGALVVRRRRPAQALLGLAHQLTEHLGTDPGGHLRLRVVTLVAPGGVVLAPHVLRPVLVGAEARLAAAGLVMSDAPLARLDAATGQVVLGPPPLPGARWEGLAPEVSGERRAGVAGWAFLGPHGSAVGRSEALGLAASTLVGVPAGAGQVALDALDAVLGRAPAVAVAASAELPALVAGLRAAARPPA